MIRPIDADVVVIGGGIAGLWLFRTLNLQGYKAVLLENNTFGGGQTSKSQGIIHGGTKYTLSASLTKSSQCIAGMPDRWRRALVGEGELDLTGSATLSSHQYLFSPGGLGSRLTTFFASKALRGRVEKLDHHQFPAVFHNKNFRGKIYRLDEIVLDINSVVKILVNGLENRCIKVDWNNNTHMVTENGDIDHINIQQDGKIVHLKADRYVIAAGEGAARLMGMWGISEPRMQLRPLHMTMVKHCYPQPIFAHCIGVKPIPRITVTTHPTADGQWVWYLGGEIAEEGVKYTPDELITTAKRELKALLPWVNLDGGKWATLKVNRAEPKQGGVLRPDSAFCKPAGNGIIAWPTKLALAPNMSDEVVKILDKNTVKPSGNEGFVLPDFLTRPELSAPFWSSYFD